MFQRVHVFVQRRCCSCFWSIIHDHYTIWQQQILDKTSRLGQMLAPRWKLKRIFTHLPVYVNELKPGGSRDAGVHLAPPMLKFEAGEVKGGACAEEDSESVFLHFRWWWWLWGFEFSDIVAFSITEPPRECPPTHWERCSVRPHPAPTPPSHSWRMEMN